VREENSKIRAEFGFLTVTDPNKFHAVRIPLDGQSRTWIYRVFLPLGNDYYAACRINDLPLDGRLPRYVGSPPSPGTISGSKNTTGIGLTGGEYVITLAVFVEDGVPKYTIQCRPSDVSQRGGQGGGTGGSQIMDVKQKWPIRQHSFALGGVHHEMTVRPADEPLVLLDFRSIGEGMHDSSSSTEGIICWIEMLP
jgi:hypothetical protein